MQLSVHCQHIELGVRVGWRLRAWLGFSPACLQGVGVNLIRNDPILQRFFADA
jgi:hypothetical protein